MPLFGRRLFVRNENDSTNDEEQTQSFTIEHTGEKFRDEKLYEKVKQVYELERWTCECTWRSALTHKQAFQSEIETRKSLESIVPSYFHKTIFDIIHQSKTIGRSFETKKNEKSFSSRRQTFGKISRRNFDNSRVNFSRFFY